LRKGDRGAGRGRKKERKKEDAFLHPSRKKFNVDVIAYSTVVVSKEKRLMMIVLFFDIPTGAVGVSIAPIDVIERPMGGWNHRIE
jgi:hypothetical protein